ncbi:hypothetical protein CRE_20835 [Caenorhabditis remanei]|uniref:Uncharacterized protein n=1 Tax=Caenorhabditis remanei TaxID=31234 RepID=E3MV23_CAERE|nr:hypothetical protein CRE_20835 [Caenorhabditis remanei]
MHSRSGYSPRPDSHRRFRDNDDYHDYDSEYQTSRFDGYGYHSNANKNRNQNSNRHPRNECNRVESRQNHSRPPYQNLSERKWESREQHYYGNRRQDKETMQRNWGNRSREDSYRRAELDQHNYRNSKFSLERENFELRDSDSNYSKKYQNLRNGRNTDNGHNNVRDRQNYQRRNSSRRRDAALDFYPSEGNYRHTRSDSEESLESEDSFHESQDTGSSDYTETSPVRNSYGRTRESENSNNGNNRGRYSKRYPDLLGFPKSGESKNWSSDYQHSNCSVRGESGYRDADTNSSYDNYNGKNRNGRNINYGDHKEHRRQSEHFSMSRDVRSSNPRNTRDYAHNSLDNQDDVQETQENFIPGERRYFHKQIRDFRSVPNQNQSGFQNPGESFEPPRRPKGSFVFSNCPNKRELAVVSRNLPYYEDSDLDGSSVNSDSDDYNEHNYRHNENIKKRDHQSEHYGHSSGSHITTTDFNQNQNNTKPTILSTGFNLGGRFGELPGDMEENQNVSGNQRDRILGEYDSCSQKIYIQFSVIPGKVNKDNDHSGNITSDFPIFHEGLIICKYSLTNQDINQKNVDSIKAFKTWRSEGLFLHGVTTDDVKIDKLYGLLSGNHSVKKTVIFVSSPTRGEELSEILSHLNIVKSNIMITSESACPPIGIDQFIQFDFPKEEERSKDMFHRCRQVGKVKDTAIHVLIHQKELLNYSEAKELKRIYEEEYRALFPGFLTKAYQRAYKYRRFDKYKNAKWLGKRTNVPVQRKYMDGFPAELSEDDW